MRSLKGRLIYLGLIGAMGILFAGCPKSPYPIPIRFMESAKSLKRGQVRISANGGFTQGPSGGPGGRVRVGVGKRHELGVAGYLNIYDDGKSTTGLELGGGLKLDWKYSPIEGVAVIFGAGGSSGNGVGGLGFDVGVIMSPVQWRVRPYLGLRAGLMLGLGADASPYLGAQAALGLEIEVNRYFSILFEGSASVAGVFQNEVYPYFVFYGSGGLQLTI